MGIVEKTDAELKEEEEDRLIQQQTQERHQNLTDQLLALRKEEQEAELQDSLNTRSRPQS